MLPQEPHLPATVYDIIEAGCDGDAYKAREYTKLLIERFEKEGGRERDIRVLRRILSGEKGRIVYPASNT